MLVNIVGLDGFDIDVAENLRVCYRRLGQSVVLSRTPMRADILAIMRGAVRELDCSGWTQVHVFNYVGQDRSAMTLTNARDVIFIDSNDVEAKRCRPQMDCKTVTREIVAWHPVYPSLWAKGALRLRAAVNHIGNYKRLGNADGDDECQLEMVAALRTLRAPVWGRGWEKILPRDCVRGPVSLWSVIEIFRSTGVTLGLRYPTQRRMNLISGRYWLGPLNGCVVLSQEPSLPTTVPGLVFSPFRCHTDVDVRDRTRASLAMEACEFWTRYSSDFETELGKILPGARSLHSAFRLDVLYRKGAYRCQVIARRIKSRIE
jgi:hypothetical protein